MYTIVVLVLFSKIKLISCDDANATIVDGVTKTLTIWPMRLGAKNAVVSTLPLRLGLNKLASVADPEAKKELMTALGITDNKTLSTLYPNLEPALQCLRESDMIMLNKFFVNHSDAIAPSFFQDPYKTFGVQVDKINFLYPERVISSVNQWADVATFKRVTEILKEGDIESNYNMILVNAIHMKLTWEFPFDVRFSIIKPFALHNMKDKIDMRMMTTLCKWFFYHRNKKHGFQALRLRLFCPGCQIFFFLPNKVSGLPKLLKLLGEKPELIEETKKQMKEEFMNIRIPLMKIKTLVDWTPYLKSIGVKKIFNNQSSGLDAISQGNTGTIHYLGKVIQKVFLEIDEFGIHREKPQNPIDMKYMMAQKEVPQFIANHPFYFRAEMEESGVTYELFSGAFYGTD